MTVLASADIGNGSSVSGNAPRLLVPKATAAQHIRAHIQRGIAIRRQRIRYIEDLEDVRALKGEWVTAYTETLKQLFSGSALADECNDWVGKVYPEFADVTLFVEQFYEEMDYRVRKLRGVLKKLDDMGEFSPRAINGPINGPISPPGVSPTSEMNGGGGTAAIAPGGMSAAGMNSAPMGMVSPMMTQPSAISSPMSSPVPSMASMPTPEAPAMRSPQIQSPSPSSSSYSGPTIAQAAAMAQPMAPASASAPMYPAPKPYAGGYSGSTSTSSFSSSNSSMSSSSSSSSPAPAATPAPGPAATLPPPPVVSDEPPLNTGIFVVHGDLRTASNTVQAFMEDLGIKLQSLPAAPEKGKGLVESLEKNPDASFAVVLLPHDDVVALRGNAADAAANVRTGIVFQLGYFVGRLGLKRVCVLYTGGNETFVSDHGIQFLPMDSGNGWHLLLARHLKRAGIEIDLNKLF